MNDEVFRAADVGEVRTQLEQALMTIFLPAVQCRLDGSEPENRA